jgi:hypothetical protein
MSSDSNKIADAIAVTPTVEDPFQADLAAIMSEIDQLSSEMNAPDPGVPLGSEVVAAQTQPESAAAPAPVATETARPALRAMTSADLEPTNVASTAEQEEEDVMAEFRNAGGDSPLDETATEVSPALVPFGGPLDQEEAPVMSNVSKIPSQTSGGNGSSGEDASLSMTLTGSMKLKLNYEFGTQSVTISFGDDGFKVQLADGTEFKIPTGAARTQRKAA